jgi:hypothetical protein
MAKIDADRLMEAAALLDGAEDDLKTEYHLANTTKERKEVIKASLTELRDIQAEMLDNILDASDDEELDDLDLGDEDLDAEGEEDADEDGEEDAEGEEGDDLEGCDDAAAAPADVGASVENLKELMAKTLEAMADFADAHLEGDEISAEDEDAGEEDAGEDEEDAEDEDEDAGEEDAEEDEEDVEASVSASDDILGRLRALKASLSGEDGEDGEVVSAAKSRMPKRALKKKKGPPKKWKCCGPVTKIKTRKGKMVWVANCQFKNKKGVMQTMKRIVGKDPKVKPRQIKLGGRKMPKCK